MKGARRVIALLFIAGCVMNGCKQDKLPTEPSAPYQPTPPIGSGVLTATIDGTPWTADDNAGAPTGTATYRGSSIHITGSRAVYGDSGRENLAAETIDLTIDLSAAQADLVPGTYELGSIPTEEGQGLYIDPRSGVFGTNNSHPGTVTITALDVARKNVSGVFAFNGIGVSGQTHVVSGGMFNVTWK